MIYLIIKSYLILLLLVVAGAITFFFGGLYWIIKPKKKIKSVTENAATQSKKPKKKIVTISSSDIHAIAGEDVFATQLDLARAYIETGKVQLAQKILDHVIEKGSNAHQLEARYLLGFI